MKKIITIVIIAIIGIVAYKAVTKNDIGKNALKKIEKQIDANKKASIGSTIVCPICHTSFEKKMFSSYDFDCDECREKYEKIVNSIDKVNEITDKAVNVVEDTKNSIKNNFCLSHNYPLYRIPFTQLNNLNINNLFSNEYLVKGDNK